MTYGWAAAEARRRSMDRALAAARRELDMVSRAMDRARSRGLWLPEPYRERFPCMAFRELGEAANDRKARAAAYAKGAG